MDTSKKYYFPSGVFDIIKQFILPSEYDRLERYAYVKNEMKRCRNNTMDKWFFAPNGERYDVEINKEIKDQFKNSELLMTHTHEFNTDSIKCITLNSPHRIRRDFIKNIRFENKNIIKDIELIRLEIGGYIIDTLYCDFYQILQDFYKMDGIPINSLKYGIIYSLLMQVVLRIEFKKNTIIRKEKLLVDVHKFNDLVDRYNLPSTSQIIYQIGHLEIYPLMSKILCTRHRLYFDHPVYFLFCKHKLRNIKLIINQGDEFKLDQLENGIIKLTNYVKFEEWSNYPINFSRIHTMQIEFECDVEKVVIESIFSNILAFNGSFYHIMFSN